MTTTTATHKWSKWVSKEGSCFYRRECTAKHSGIQCDSYQIEEPGSVFGTNQRSLLNQIKREGR